jgi:hypothetical protein
MNNEARRRKGSCGVDLISDALPFGHLWYTEIPHAIGYAEFRSRSHDAVIPVYDDACNVIETHDHAGYSKAFGLCYGPASSSSAELDA